MQPQVVDLFEETSFPPLGTCLARMVSVWTWNESEPSRTPIGCFRAEVERSESFRRSSASALDPCPKDCLCWRASSADRRSSRQGEVCQQSTRVLGASDGLGLGCIAPVAIRASCSCRMVQAGPCLSASGACRDTSTKVCK